MLALLNSFQQGHIGNTENIGNIWTTIKSKIQKHTKSKQKHYGPTTKTNQQAYCQHINTDIDRESKYLFTYKERERKKNTAFKWQRWVLIVASSDSQAKVYEDQAGIFGDEEL